MNWNEYGSKSVINAINRQCSVFAVIKSLEREQCTAYGREALYGAIGQCLALIEPLRAAGIVFRTSENLDMSPEMRLLKANRLIKTDMEAANAMISECLFAVENALKKHQITLGQTVKAGAEESISKVHIVQMPVRQTSTVIERNDKGEIVSTSQIEQDV